MFAAQTFTTTVGGRTLKVEVGKVAHQANASCLVSYGDSMVLATAVMSKDPRAGIDFFPLTVEMQEKMYAAGKIKGSRFIKREGRPTDNSVLVGRMIDRGLRPLFNQAMRHEVQVIVTALSYDDENDLGVLAITAAGLALHISDIPWNGPLVGVSVGRVNNELVLNPTTAQLEQSDFKLVFSIKDQAVIMVDAEGREISEDVMGAAFAFGIDQIQPVVQFIEDIRAQIGLPKKSADELVALASQAGEIPLSEKEAVFAEAKQFFAPQLDQYLFNQPRGTKRERKLVAQELLKKFIESLDAEKNNPEIISYIKQNFESYLEEVVTAEILKSGRRIDGRALDQIRPLSAEVGLLPRTHGSGLFSRGETQVLTVVTLGAPGDAQILDEMTQDDVKKQYMHFYNALPFCYGETGFVRGPGRREIGHGALAEKALQPVLPLKPEFPYTMLVMSEVMGSNGSSSMASTCGSTLALMDAGVPIKNPVAGVAMGLASQGDQFKILTDLQDFEDGQGGMDFKIAGTRDGITAIQMDTKTLGLSLTICQETLQRAKQARVQILEAMALAIATPRPSLSPYAPRIETIMINPDKIRDVIGPGGKIINEIIDKCGVEIDIEQDGTVMVTGTNVDGVQAALKWVQNLTKEIEVGEVYTGPVTRLMDFGAFVEILPGREGLVHISEFSEERIDRISDVAKIGDHLTVRVYEIDSQGRVNLSVKRARPDYQPRPDDGERRGNGGGRHDHGSRNGGHRPHSRPRF